MKINDNSKLVRIPYLKKTDVGRITGYTRKDLNALFDAAQEIDKKELGINYVFTYKVRTKTVALNLISPKSGAFLCLFTFWCDTLRIFVSFKGF
ncbi:hypothetical protein [Solobacterium moorei]|uniref:Uncharacterized protein n=1 Tax=Solobacterium moorei TaxID=102148 RepID=A0A412PDG7_9FIRM|nr:hypothetical protein [Solobacterium moorei]RGT55093.1 hypothetical protein DWX20_08030 [Solobacterium moorei]